MNNFKAAHIIAKNTINAVGDYRVAFSLALKLVYKALKVGYEIKAVITGTIKSWSGAIISSSTSKRSEFVAKSRANAERYIKENKANAGKIWEQNGEFRFYVYA